MTKAELNSPNFTSIIAEPVWDQEIEYFFDEQDYNCMMHADGEQQQSRTIDLKSYTEVSALSAKIYYYVYYKFMPMGKTKWNNDKLFSFRNWLTHGCPKNTEDLETFKTKQAAILEDTSLRQRKNVNTLTAQEQTILIKAFQGIMDLPKDDPNSFYTLGGLHWYPGVTYCEHHIHPFLAWHRAYILQFENALRTIPGCEAVTLPYWDISDDTYPELFSKAPFIASDPKVSGSTSSYQLPQDFLEAYPFEVTNGSLKADGSIIRNSAAIYNTQKWKFFRDATHDPTNTNKMFLDKIIQLPTWNAFNGLDKTGQFVSGSETLMHAHDMVHDINGATTANQDVTGFEPVFWLFHANWDRLMWRWQKLHHTTNVADFKKNVKACGDSTDWIDGIGLNNMDPFTTSLGLTVDQTIDLNAMGINYVETALPLTEPEDYIADELSLQRVSNKGQSKSNAFTLSDLSYVSLRVKDVNRLKIPGSFTVSLYLDGALQQTRFFLQATNPGNCENCVKQALVSFDFVFKHEQLLQAKGKVKVEIQLSNGQTDGQRPVIPFRTIGQPTINIRLVH